MTHEEKLTPSEEEVMERIWAYGPCAPKDILDLYDDPKPHVNTVATMFQSLERKGFLTHVVRGRRAQGRLRKEPLQQLCEAIFRQFLHERRVGARARRMREPSGTRGIPRQPEN